MSFLLFSKVPKYKEVPKDYKGTVFSREIYKLNESYWPSYSEDIGTKLCVILGLIFTALICLFFDPLLSLFLSICVIFISLFSALSEFQVFRVRKLNAIKDANNWNNYIDSLEKQVSTKITNNFEEILNGKKQN